MKNCPKCKLINESSAHRCDCGYNFETGQVERSGSQSRYSTNMDRGRVRRLLHRVLGGVVLAAVFVWLVAAAVQRNGDLPPIWQIALVAVVAMFGYSAGAALIDRVSRVEPQSDASPQPAAPPNAVPRLGAADFVTLLKLGVAIAVGWFLFGGGMEMKVARDAEENYETAKRAGALDSACHQAGLVAALWVRANDAERVVRWKAIERCACARAQFIPLPGCD